jgi:hypothetical protein
VSSGPRDLAGQPRLAVVKLDLSTFSPDGRRWFIAGRAVPCAVRALRVQCYACARLPCPVGAALVCWPSGQWAVRAPGRALSRPGRVAQSELGRFRFRAGTRIQFSIHFLIPEFICSNFQNS